MYGGVRGVPGNRAPISIVVDTPRCGFKSKTRFLGLNLYFGVSTA